ncbi:pyruvate formate lyase-activating protein [Ursidibacter sp. B-7004-1]
MRGIRFFVSFCVLLSATTSAQWIKIKDAEYVWGPFKIYNISLFSETGQYEQNTRPIMLTLKYHKPVDGRDFAISLARSWSNLGITLSNQNDVVDRLRKILPDIKEGDRLSYIALEDKGYFILNDKVIAEEFNQDFNNAVVAVWLDPRVEIGKKLLSQNIKQDDTNENEALNPVLPIPEELLNKEQQNQYSAVEPRVTTDVTAQENQAKDIEKLDNKSQEQERSKFEESKTEESKTEEQEQKSDQNELEIEKKLEPELQQENNEIYISPPMDSTPIPPIS